MDKILIISYSFPPDNVPAAQRPYFMAKYLQEMHLLKPIVLTSRSSLSSLGKSHWADLSDLEIVYTDNAAVEVESPTTTTPQPTATKATPKKAGKLFSMVQTLSREVVIPDKAITWYRRACKWAEKVMEENKDIKYVFSTSPSVVNHMVALKIKKKYGVKWVADFRDFYYSGNLQFADFIFRQHIDKRLERSILKAADKVTFISAGMRDEYNRVNPHITSKAAVIHNGFDENEFSFTPPDLAPDKKLTIFYGGSFYKGQRSPKPLLDALEALVKDGTLKPEEVELKIAGNIPADIFEDFTNYKIFPSINLLGFISRKSAIEEMLNAHFLWLIIAPEKAHYLGFPVKGYEYIGARRHILAFTPAVSEPARIMNELKCGTVFSTLDTELEDNVNQLRNLITDYKAGNYNSPISLDSNNLKKYTRKYQAEELFELLKQR